MYLMIQNTENSKERISIPQNPNALTIRKNDRNKIIFGSVLTLHTFDRDLKWNPHILCLVCEEAFDTQKNKMKNFSFISYEKLRKTWMYQVLDLLSKQKIKNFRYLKQKLYEELVNGFYVYAKKRKEK
ncbi:MAG: transposase [Catenibacterium mitsuokai]|nr:transposase [Catenibacterium mitsuokai]